MPLEANFNQIMEAKAVEQLGVERYVRGAEPMGYPTVIGCASFTPG